MSESTKNIIARRSYSRQWKILLTFAILTEAASIFYLRSSSSSVFYIDYLFIWPLIGAVYSGLVYLLPELQGRLSNVLVCLGLMIVMIGSAWKGMVDTDTVASQYLTYVFMGGMMMFLAGVVLSLLSGAWKLRC